MCLRAFFIAGSRSVMINCGGPAGMASNQLQNSHTNASIVSFDKKKKNPRPKMILGHGDLIYSHKCTIFKIVFIGVICCVEGFNDVSKYMYESLHR